MATSSTCEIKLTRIFGQQGSGNGEFHYPWDVAANSSGIEYYLKHLWVI